jgi:protein-tyrosine phosphatase
MIDIHCHILPGIDDGADTLEESVDFCRMASADGVRTIVATPHMRYDTFPNSREVILGSLGQVRDQIKKESIPVQLLPGAEVHLAPDVAERCSRGELITYADAGKYLLLELPYQQFPAKVEEVVFQLRLQGVTPILAHPERIAYFFDDAARLGRLIELGALTQFTASSVCGKFGTQVQEFCWDMLQRGWIDSLASDAPDLRYRPPRLSEGVARLAEWVGEETAQRMVDGVPRGILEGRNPEEIALRRPPEPPARKRRGWWFRFGRGSSYR